MTSSPASTSLPAPLAYLLLTGGRAARLGGIDKAGIRLGEVTALARAVAIAGGRTVVVVGPQAPDIDTVIRVREEPPFGGPAAAVATGASALAAVTPPLPPESLVALWGVDQVGVTGATWARLAAAVGTDTVGRRPEGAILVREGRGQHTISVVRFDALRQACDRRSDWRDQSLRALLEPIEFAPVPALDAAEARDIDTLEDLQWWARRGEQV